MRVERKKIPEVPEIPIESEPRGNADADAITERTLSLAHGTGFDEGYELGYARGLSSYYLALLAMTLMVVIFMSLREDLKP